MRRDETRRMFVTGARVLTRRRRETHRNTEIKIYEGHEINAGRSARSSFISCIILPKGRKIL